MDNIKKIFEKFVELLKDFQKDLFPFFQELGLHILHNHFYSPIPDTRFIKNQKIYNYKIFGFDEKENLKFFNYLHKKYEKEWSLLINEFNIENGTFEGLDAFICYSIIREFKPKKIIEIGSGNTTKLFLIAGNKKINLTCIDPYYQEITGVNYFIKDRVENIDIDFFKRLDSNDILFIDSSHTVKSQNDVLFLIFEVFPVLKKGVIIHFHDIFLPLDYPISWIKEELRFWNEQYIVGAFLMENKNYKILISNSLLGFKYPEIIKEKLPLPEKLKSKYENIYRKMFNNVKWFGGGSLWLKKL